MKLGVCCSDKGFAAARANGLSYAEPAMAAYRGKRNDELEKLRRYADGTGISVDGFNCFFGSDISLYGDGMEKVVSYAERNFEVARIFGASYCVLGSGKARSVPHGKSKTDTEKMFCELLNAIGDKAGEYGVRIFLEPLQHAETDLINTLSDGVEMCRTAGNKNVSCLVDFYHFYMNGEDLSEFGILQPGELGHVHIARPDADRGAPAEENTDVMSAWINKLRSIGYDGRISIECTWKPDFDSDLASAVSVMKKIL